MTVFYQISDHQQNMVQWPLRKVFLIPPALLVVVDSSSELKQLKLKPKGKMKFVHIVTFGLELSA